MVARTEPQIESLAPEVRTSNQVWEFLRAAPLLPLLILLTVIFAAVFANVIAPHDPERSVKQESGRPVKSYLPPFWMKGGSLSTPLGTDFHSRDILSRLIYGARVSLLVGIVGTVVAGARRNNSATRRSSYHNRN